MFGWFKKTITRDVHNVYQPKERLIYSYWDGKDTRKADPMILYRKVMDDRASLSANMTAATTESKFAPQAYKDMLVTIRKIFEVEPLDKGGLTEAETCALLDHFMTYVDELKKSTDLPPISPATTSPSTPSS